MPRDVYVNRVASFLPGPAIDNDRMEHVLGLVNGHPSRVRQRVLQRNGIQKRHYVIDQETGRPLWNNAQLTAEAIRKLYDSTAEMQTIDTLACGTSVPDQIIPSHAAMVHGELGIPPCEVVATAGVCASSVAAMKYGWMAIASGASEHAVVTGSEVASTLLRANMFAEEAAAKARSGGDDVEIAIDREFLRWMLSDGAGALQLGAKPMPGALKVDWIEIFSYANEAEACMYAGADKMPDGRLKGWREHDNYQDLLARSVLAIKQDVRLLRDHIGVTITKALGTVRQRRGVTPDTIDWFLPHMSSEYFRGGLVEALEQIGFDIPQERWFTNLSERGNTGSASMHIMLDDLVRGGALRRGQRILCYVPESGRFTSAWVHLTAQ
jgi:3-oxoacyl-[acyl-carrier-protein] synthase III